MGNGVKKRRSARWVFLSLLAIYLSLQSFAAYRAFYRGQRIDVRRLGYDDHPLYQQPTRPDGSVDYWQRLNQLEKERVPEAENFAVALLAVVPEPQVTRTDRQRWEQYFSAKPSDNRYRLRTGRLLQQLRPSRSRFVGELRQFSLNEYRSDPVLLAEVRQQLDGQSQCLEYLLQQLDQRPGYWMPLIRDTGSGNALHCFKQDVIHAAREVQVYLKARCDVQMVAGDLPGAWQSIRGMFQLAQRQSQSIWPTEKYAGLARYHQAVEQLNVWVNQIQNQPELLKRVEQKLPDLMQVDDWDRAIDQFDRANALQCLDSLIAGDFAPEPAYDIPSGRGNPWGWVDQQELAKRWNRRVDRSLRLWQDDSTTWEMIASFQQEVDQPHSFRWTPALGKIALSGSPRAEATDYVWGVMLRSVPTVGTSDWELVRKFGVMRSQAQLMLAIRMFQLEHQRFPDDLLQVRQGSKNQTVRRIIDSDLCRFDVITAEGKSILWIYENRTYSTVPSFILDTLPGQVEE